jgi:hypothetical protein
VAVTIIEALKESKESGRSYMRVRGGGGFVRWVDGFVYEFEADDLIADDWEPVETGIPKLTNGRWEAADK